MFNWYKQWKTYKEELRKQNKLLHGIVDWTETILVALFLALIIRTWVMQTSVVISGSMIPTLEINDRIFVNKFIYNFREPQRGEIILFKAPLDPSKEFVKRLVGLPGEIITVRNGDIMINGKLLPALSPLIRKDQVNFGPVKIPAGSYFFMGDNRANSADSRYWGFVKKEALIGQAFFTYWPPTHIRLLH